MKTVKILALILCLIFVSISLFSCDFETDNTNQENGKNASTQPDNPSQSDKQKVVNIFMSQGEYSNGVYSFRKHSTTGNCDFVYSFVYNPEIDMFYCGVLVTTHAQSIVMYDYGSVTFTWDDFENAYITGYHELENIASINFDFYASNPTSNMTFSNYQYSVRSNSFTNLTNKKEIKNKKSYEEHQKR